MEEIELILNDQKIIGLYLGQKNENFNSFI